MANASTTVANVIVPQVFAGGLATPKKRRKRKARGAKPVPTHNDGVLKATTGKSL